MRFDQEQGEQRNAKTKIYEGLRDRIGELEAENETLEAENESLQDRLETILDTEPAAVFD